MKSNNTTNITTKTMPTTAGVGVVFVLLVCVTVMSLQQIGAASQQISLDIHLTLDQTTANFTYYLSALIREKAPNDTITLGPEPPATLPHITLYLTFFQSQFIPQIQQQVANLVNNISSDASCGITLTNTTVQGAYGMWNVNNTACLQRMSDLVVNSTYMYIVPNQTVPSWVYQLPEPERSEKIAYVQKYGSPNVFSQFQPHVTLAWDDTDNLQEVFDMLPIKPITFLSPSVGIGNVGPYGTVLDNKYGNYSLSS
eukprot:TRINITY_DN11025_c0_g1_i1.p1 TRINITY_DN11025_c0_g1~~TRINITY_DN11025_c0_g1_i1.p1  ORF type:complete len:255 (-),score=48.40 TRINITY_DN11025_c0_g1_i1:122-886(-)